MSFRVVYIKITRILRSFRTFIFGSLRSISLLNVYENSFKSRALITMVMMIKWYKFWYFKFFHWLCLMKILQHFRKFYPKSWKYFIIIKMSLVFTRIRRTMRTRKWIFRKVSEEFNFSWWLLSMRTTMITYYRCWWFVNPWVTPKVFFLQWGLLSSAISFVDILFEVTTISLPDSFWVMHQIETVKRRSNIFKTTIIVEKIDNTFTVI